MEHEEKTQNYDYTNDEYESHYIVHVYSHWQINLILFPLESLWLKTEG